MSAPPAHTRTGPKPFWPAVTDEALLTSPALVRVLAAMGFHDIAGTTRRGNIVWWQPAYAACPAKAPPTLRAMYAANNRARRDAEVWLMLHDQTVTSAVTAVDTSTGAWILQDQTQRGEDLISLGMVRWSCGFGQAANRIARAIGMPSIPTVQPIAREDLFKGASFAFAPALPAEQSDA